MNLTNMGVQVRIGMTDFELTIINALKAEFPGIEIGGCFFHFGQALFRHVQQLGLAGPYQQDGRVKWAVKKTMALAFIPVNFVRGKLHSLAPANLVLDFVDLIYMIILSRQLRGK